MCKGGHRKYLARMVGKDGMTLCFALQDSVKSDEVQRVKAMQASNTALENEPELSRQEGRPIVQASFLRCQSLLPVDDARRSYEHAVGGDKQISYLGKHALVPGQARNWTGATDKAPARPNAHREWKSYQLGWKAPLLPRPLSEVRPKARPRHTSLRVLLARQGVRKKSAACAAQDVTRYVMTVFVLGSLLPDLAAPVRRAVLGWRISREKEPAAGRTEAAQIRSPP